MNMLDYLQSRGNISFKKEPFNDVDNLILSHFAYIPFSEYLPEQKKVTLADLFTFYATVNPLSKIDGRQLLDYRFLGMLSQSERFKDCVVHHYISILHEENAEQFAAMMIDLPDQTTVIAFRGTDDSLVGWKEDLMLSYRDIYSQDDAVTYMRKYCSTFKKYRIIGHSKGGYLAIYAAVNCGAMLQRNIINVISNDGPGLREGSYDPKKFRKIADRYRLIVPERDIIGNIYQMAEDVFTVDTSSSNIIANHNMFTWNVEGNLLVPGTSASYETELTRKVITRFLEQTNEIQREFFVDELFEKLTLANITTFRQFAEKGIVLIIGTLRKLMTMDPMAKQTILLMIRLLTANLNIDFRRSLKEKARRPDRNVVMTK